MDINLVLFIAIGVLACGMGAGLRHAVVVARRRTRKTRTWRSNE